MADFSEYLDQVFTYFSGEKFQERLGLGKKTYIDFAGTFDEDQHDIESKWIQFRDWYLFDFTYNNQSCIDIVSEVPDLDNEIKESLQQARSSVFYFYKESRGWVYFRDLITRDKISFKNSDVILLLEKNNYIQTRVFRYKEAYHLGAFLTVHPNGSEKYIDTKAKQIRKEKNIELKLEKKSQLLDSLLKQYFQNQRFRQVDVRKIYSDEPLFERKAEPRL